jgi:hypothetical protein
LGRAGATAIPQEEDARLKGRWEKSDLWPRTGEDVTAGSGGERITGFSNFCPALGYDRYNIFASAFFERHDEIDTDIAYKKLKESEIPYTD